MDVENKAKNRTNFLHVSPVLFGDACSGAVALSARRDMQRHIILSTIRRSSNFSPAFLSLIIIVKGQCHEQVKHGEVGMKQTAELALSVPLVQSLLDLCCWLLPFASLLGFGVYREDLYLHVFTAIMFLLSVCSLHLCSLSCGCCVNIYYKPAIREHDPSRRQVFRL